MDPVSMPAKADSRAIRMARELYFERGEAPQGLLDGVVLRSWERCRQSGLEPRGHFGADVASLAMLEEKRARNRLLLAHTQSIMEHVYEQIRDSGSMVILSDVNGMLLQCVGDPDFVTRAERVALQPGASWDESERGTNAIGTAIVEERAVEVFGGEHFLDRNGFLTCNAAPLFDSQGRLIGVLDISGDYRSVQRHTLGLVRLSAQLAEKRLFESEQAREILVGFHTRIEHVGGLSEGLLAVSGEGTVRAVNRAGLELLKLGRQDVVNRDFAWLFDTPLAVLIDRARREPGTTSLVQAFNGKQYVLTLRGHLGGTARVMRLADAEPVRAPASRPRAAARTQGLNALATGDARLQAAIDRARRVLGRDIPILIQGESGAGKEMFARAFHQDGPRAEGPFVALNCAAIPETLIESELFGYQGGAFTGARKDGAPGKIQQAHGGTLFLDEIGDMPLNLQARLLRVLQERSVTPLGGTKAVAVDLSLVCATHRNLKAEIARGNFREDLFYRLNGLCITLPALRERTDLRALIAKLLAAELGAERQVTVAEDAMCLFERYSWPGNIRQLYNVLRVAVALLDPGERLITAAHLPEELLEPEATAPRDTVTVAPASPPAGHSLDEIERRAIQTTLDAERGNVSAAARKLGISRNTLYRKMGRF